MAWVVDRTGRGGCGRGGGRLWPIHFKEGDGCRHRTGGHEGPPPTSSPRYTCPPDRVPLRYDEAARPRPCIVGAGEDVDVGMGPLWLPVRAHHRLSSPHLQCIGPCGCPSELLILNVLGLVPALLA